MSIPRPEYPRPQFQRDAWSNLNGPWQFQLDPGDSGEERGWPTEKSWQEAQTIQVPFCPESKLSGIHHEDFMPVVWYAREVQLPEEWAGNTVLLHFGAVDYEATVWVDGEEVYRHRGGHTPFTCELTRQAQANQRHRIVLRARDPREGAQPRGKQSSRYAPYSCWYTRTTGIWQTVWMEPVAAAHFQTPRITPDFGTATFQLQLPLSQNVPGHQITASLKAGDRLLHEVSAPASLDFSPALTLTIPKEAVRPWSTEDPFLYDLEFTLKDAEGRLLDRMQSYAGLRSIAIEGQVIRLNGRPVFQRLVLDQGFWPDSVMTAPDEAALIADIELSIAAGFNGARLHQKVFEPRFLYHADRLGYLVWGEFPDWGSQFQGPYQDHFGGGATYITQWLEAVLRDYSHPSIIGWCPLNEQRQEGSSHLQQLDDVQRGMFLAAKAMDPTRPVLDASGWSHRVRESDIYDSHDYLGGKDYETAWKTFCEHHEKLAEGEAYTNPVAGTHPGTLPYRGQPYFVSEIGGFRWLHPGDPHAEAQPGWGYGVGSDDIENFYERFERLLTELLNNRGMFGYCYTQLTDIPPEMNGIFTFDRTSKFDLARLKAIQTKIAAIERDNPVITS